MQTKAVKKFIGFSLLNLSLAAPSYAQDLYQNSFADTGSTKRAAASQPVSMQVRSTAHHTGPIAPLSRKEIAVRLNEEAVTLVFQGEHKQAEKKLSRALEFDSANPTILYNSAGLQMHFGNHTQAMRLMDQAVRLSPNDLSVLNRLADVAVATKDYKKAVSAYERIAAKDKKYKNVLLKLGALYGMLEDWRKAEEYLLEAQKIQGNTPGLLSNLGNILIASGKYKDAVPILEEAQKISPNKANAVALGIAYESMQKREKALEHFKHAQSLGEESERLKLHIEELSDDDNRATDSAPTQP